MIFMTSETDTIVFIDAGYLSLISKFLGKGKHIKFDIGKFSSHLASMQNLKLKRAFYYAHFKGGDFSNFLFCKFTRLFGENILSKYSLRRFPAPSF